MLLSPAQPRGTRRPKMITGILSHRRWAGALVLLSLVVLRPGQAPSAHAQPQAGGPDQKAAAAEAMAGVVERYEGLLGDLDRRLTALARPVLEEVARSQGNPDRSVDQIMRTRQAEIDYLNAKSAREVAELTRTEYDQGTRQSELATAEARIMASKEEVERAQRRIAEAKKRLARISGLAPQSASGLDLVYQYTDRVEKAELLEQQARLQLSAVEDEKKVLAEYTIPKRLKELDSDAHKARAEELARNAAWEIEKGKLAALRKNTEHSGPAEKNRRVLALIDQAIPLEDKIRAKLGELAGPNPRGAELANEMIVFLDQLRSLVARAEAIRNIDDFARLKPRLQQSARKYRHSSAK